MLGKSKASPRRMRPSATREGGNLGVTDSTRGAQKKHPSWVCSARDLRSKSEGGRKWAPATMRAVYPSSGSQRTSTGTEVGWKLCRGCRISAVMTWRFSSMAEALSRRLPGRTQLWSEVAAPSCPPRAPAGSGRSIDADLAPPGHARRAQHPDRPSGGHARGGRGARRRRRPTRGRGQPAGPPRPTSRLREAATEGRHVPHRPGSTWAALDLTVADENDAERWSPDPAHDLLGSAARWGVSVPGGHHPASLRTARPS